MGIPAVPDPAPTEIASLFTVVVALGGLLVLGIATMAEMWHLGFFVPGTFVVPAALLGALVLTSPALLALHQFLQLRASPEAVVAALARGLVAAGTVATGLAPVALFFAATTRVWVVLLPLSLALVGTVAAVVTLSSLCAAETQKGRRFKVLLAGWTALTIAIAARISFSLWLDMLGLVEDFG
jgi:hypothetical protein